MAEIIPFRAWRYNTDKAGTIEQLISPLMDALNPAQAADLLIHPYNAIHFADPEDGNTLLAQLQAWKANDILKQDVLPAIYPFYQTFRLPIAPQPLTRKGFIALMRIDPKVIILHERVREPIVQHRANVLSQSCMQLTPTHGLFNDPDFEVISLLDDYQQAPLLAATDVLGVENSLSAIQNPKHIRQIQHFMAKLPIYLADGHHRWETSRRVYARLQHSAAAYHLMYFSNLAGEDLRILPTHRVVSLPDDFSINSFLQRLEPYFSISTTTDRPPAHTFQFVLKGQSYHLRLKSHLKPESLVALDLPDSVKRLDYTLLHYLVFDRALSIPYEEQPNHPSILYVKDSAQAIAYGQNQHLAILLNEVTLEELLAVCQDGALMPQKSTFFYPKVAGGLVFASIAADDYLSPFDKIFLANK